MTEKGPFPALANNMVMGSGFHKKLRSDSIIGLRGAVTQVLKGPRFRVALPDGRQVLACMAGRIRRGFVRINEGDLVHVELSAYDLGKARITFAQSAR